MASKLIKAICTIYHSKYSGSGTSFVPLQPPATPEDQALPEFVRLYLSGVHNIVTDIEIYDYDVFGGLLDEAEIGEILGALSDVVTLDQRELIAEDFHNILGYFYEALVSAMNKSMSDSEEVATGPMELVGTLERCSFMSNMHDDMARNEWSKVVARDTGRDTFASFIAAFRCWFLDNKDDLLRDYDYNSEDDEDDEIDDDNEEEQEDDDEPLTQEGSDSEDDS